MTSRLLSIPTPFPAFSQSANPVPLAGAISVELTPGTRGGVLVLLLAAFIVGLGVVTLWRSRR